MFNPARLVFIDETSANTKMVRLYGRCARGERLVGHVPQGHWKTITFVAALRRHSVCFGDHQYGFARGSGPCGIGRLRGRGSLQMASWPFKKAASGGRILRHSYGRNGAWRCYHVYRDRSDKGAVLERCD